jgi:hypothetical protein
MGVVGCGSRVRCERSRGCGGEVHGGVSGSRGARINRRRDRGESGAVASGAGGECEARDLVGGDGEVPGSSWLRRLAYGATPHMPQRNALLLHILLLSDRDDHAKREDPFLSSFFSWEEPNGSPEF